MFATLTLVLFFPLLLLPFPGRTWLQDPGPAKARGMTLLPRGSVLFENLVPPEVRLPRVVGKAPFLVQVRYVRVVVPIWGYKVAALFDDGPWCGGEWQRGIGKRGLSVVNVKRDPAGTRGYLEKRILPLLGKRIPPGLPDLPPAALVPPAHPALDVLRARFLQASWPSFKGKADLDTFTRAWLEEEVRDGLLHEIQHSFYGFNGPPRPLPQWENEERSHLTALAHSRNPHQVWFRILGQYRRGKGIYYLAVRDILERTVRRILEHPPSFPGINSGKNLMAQLPGLSPEDLRKLAAWVFRKKWAPWKKGRGLDPDFSSPPILRKEWGTLDTSPGTGATYPGERNLPPPGRGVSLTVRTGKVEARGIRPFTSSPWRPPAERRHGRTHWRIAGGDVLGGSFRAPRKVKKALLSILHMATRDGRGRGGGTFVTIVLNGKQVLSGHAPPPEDKNPLERPEVFDVTPYVLPGRVNRIAYALDPVKKSRLVSWVEGFKLEFQ